jgi:hypothetical protein
MRVESLDGWRRDLLRELPLAVDSLKASGKLLDQIGPLLRWQAFRVSEHRLTKLQDRSDTACRRDERVELGGRYETLLCY